MGWLRFFICITVVLISACRLGTSEPDRFLELDDRLKVFLKTDERVFRGIDFGSSLEEIKNKEGAGNNTGNYLFYKVALSEQDHAEIYYYLDSKEQVESFSIDVFLSDQQSTEEFFYQLSRYYMGKYGYPEEDKGLYYKWDFDNGDHNLTLEAIHEADDYGVEIDIR